MAKDIFHDAIKTALEKEGWRITHDPYAFELGEVSFRIDLGAERVIAAEKGNEKIAVEIKTFIAQSDTNSFHKAIDIRKMDKIIKYQDIIEQFLEEEAAIPYANQDLKREVLVDRKRNHFQLFFIGWEDNKFYYDIILHFDIKENGKVWIQQNNTELQIADELINCGIAHEDIVLGFRHPKVRQFTGFAVA